MISPTQLQLLVGLREYGTVRAVAEAMMFSPSAVSAQLNQLERRVGVKLFERYGRNLRLTEAGELLTKRAREIVGRLDDAEKEVRELGHQPLGTVRVSALTSVLQNLMPEIVDRTEELYPGVDLVLRENEPDEVAASVRRGLADLGISSYHPADGEPALDGLSRTDLFLDEIVACFSRQNAKRFPGMSVRPKELEHEQWVLDSGQISSLLGSIGRHWSDQPRVVAEFPSYPLALEYVGAGRGVTLQPALATRRYDGIVTKSLDPRVHRMLYLCARGAQHRRAVRVVADIIIAVSADRQAAA